MKSRALVLSTAFLAAVLIGCGGGGGGGGTKNPTTGTTSGTTTGVPGAGPGDSIAMVNLPAPAKAAGRVNIAYLPLQGRALETFTAIIRQIQLGLGAQTFVEPLNTPISFVMNGNEVQQRSASIPVTSGGFRDFDRFYLNIDSFIDDPSPNGPPDNDKLQKGNSDNPFVDSFQVDAHIRILPSRETTVPIFLNDAMVQITLDPETDSVIDAAFAPDVFLARNQPPINGFLSDFLMFDVSGMGVNRPQMSTGARADRVYFSGDRFALSADGPKGYFEMLTTDLAAPKPGEFQDPVLIGSTQTPGIYRTLVPDPTDPGSATQITEFLGIFRPFVDPNLNSRSMVVNTGTFEVVLMPRSDDNDQYQILLVVMNGPRASNMYWGDARLSSGTFVAYPLTALTTGSTSGAIQGTLSGYLNASGSPVSLNSPDDGSLVRYGRYALPGGPLGFKNSGRFIVFRR